MVIGFAGRIDPIKNLESLIDAFGKISRDVGSFYLVIVGDGPQSYVDELKSQAQHAGVLTTVQFLPGAVIYEAIQAFDIGISCSLSEGFSNVIGELMSCEKPCVVTDVGDSAAIVGDTGLVVPPNSVAALHRGIMRLASENEHSMRERGRLARSRITNLFGLTQLVDRTEQTLKTVLTGEEPMCHSR
jgi:glycosyltransferase involved in cell wall biosynthesis